MSISDKTNGALLCAASGSRGLTVECSEAAVILTIDAAEQANSLNSADLVAFGAILEVIARAEEVRALIITGAGERVFSAGYDLQELALGAPATVLDNEFPRLAKKVAELNKPVIAAVNGAVVGAAVHLVFSCDIRIAVASATFRLPAASLGIIYDPEAIVRLAYELGPGICRRLLLAGQDIPAEDLKSAGCIEDVVRRNALLDMAKRKAADFHTLAPLAVSGMKEILNAIGSRGHLAGRFEQMKAEAAASDHVAAILTSITKKRMTIEP